MTRKRNNSDITIDVDIPEELFAKVELGVRRLRAERRRAGLPVDAATMETLVVRHLPAWSAVAEANGGARTL